MEFFILPARIQDAQKLTEIALASKGSWGYPDHWVEGWKSELEITAESARNDTIFKATSVKSEILGFYRLTVENAQKLILSGFWVQKAYMGFGVGSELFRHMQKTACKIGALLIEWESDPHAVNFYKHMGARQIGLKSYYIDTCRRDIPIMRIFL